MDEFAKALEATSSLQEALAREPLAKAKRGWWTCNRFLAVASPFVGALLLLDAVELLFWQGIVVEPARQGWYFFNALGLEPVPIALVLLGSLLVLSGVFGGYARCRIRHHLS